MLTKEINYSEFIPDCNAPGVTNRLDIRTLVKRYKRYDHRGEELLYFDVFFYFTLLREKQPVIETSRSFITLQHISTNNISLSSSQRVYNDFIDISIETSTYVSLHYKFVDRLLTDAKRLVEKMSKGKKVVIDDMPNSYHFVTQ